MNRGLGSYSASSLLYNKPKSRKTSSAKRKKTREGSKEKRRNKKYNSPGKIMGSNYIPQPSTQTFVFKNPSTDPINLRYGAVRPSHAESAFKNLVYSPGTRQSSKTKKPKTGFSSTYKSSGTKSNSLIGSFSKK